MGQAGLGLVVVVAGLAALVAVGWRKPTWLLVIALASPPRWCPTPISARR